MYNVQFTDVHCTSINYCYILNLGAPMNCAVLIYTWQIIVLALTKGPIDPSCIHEYNLILDMNFIFHGKVFFLLL